LSLKLVPCKAKNKGKTRKHHHPTWLSPPIFAYERGEKNNCSRRSTILRTSLDPNHEYPLTSFLINRGALEANKALM